MPGKKIKKTTIKKSVPKKKGKDNGKIAFRPDNKQTAVLVKAGRAGAANAIRASKALDLSITYMEKGVIFKEFADGTKKKLANAAKGNIADKKSAGLLKKGMVFHAKK